MGTQEILPEPFAHYRRRRHGLPFISSRTSIACLALVSALCFFNFFATSSWNAFAGLGEGGDGSSKVQRVPMRASEILARCAATNVKAGMSEGELDMFWTREESERWDGGNATLIRNATIWTGARSGTEVVYGDLLLSKGIVKGIGHIPRSKLAKFNIPPALAVEHNFNQSYSKSRENLTIVDANGRWLTPGLFDLHSHIGLLAAPHLAGAFDVNSPNGPVLPFLRSLDGLNTHDDARALALAGGVTSGLVLPGSGNAIGGQAVVVKWRKRRGLGPSAMVVEPPAELHVNGSHARHYTNSTPWRHMKQACGENLRKYGTRMDSIWSFRAAYGEARKIKQAQDDYCAAAAAGLWNVIEGKEFPESLQWEMLVDVLRGRVKINNHCYEAVDLDDIVRLTNEFEFPLAAFHHASEAWLVPDLLKQTYGGPPAVAIFATNHRYKRESYRGSEFAPRVLADNGIAVVMKSDHPVIKSRYLVHEAQQAYHFGLAPNLALASVTSTPASAAGLAHRLGVLREGADADVVLWDAHPLQIGAVPLGVWVDGVREVPAREEDGGVGWVNDWVGNDGDADVEGERQRVPSVPDYDKEREEAIRWEGLQPLAPKQEAGTVVFRNVGEIWLREEGRVEKRDVGGAVVVVANGSVVCTGSCTAFVQEADAMVDLRGGAIAPAFTAFGSPLGLEEIQGEPSTGDGALYDPFMADVPAVMGDVAGVLRAADALQFGTRNALTAHISGVTKAVSSLTKRTLFAGALSLTPSVSVAFRTGASGALERGAVLNEATALHVTIQRAAPYASGAASVSAQVAALRRLLLGGEERGETGLWFRQAAEGRIPLVVDVGSADVMATLLRLKDEVEEKRGSMIRMVFARATEAHLIADRLAEAKVGVILVPWRQYPETWDDRRILPGPPLTNATVLKTLLDAGVTVGIAPGDAWQARNTRFEAAWAALEVGEERAVELVSANLDDLLGVWDGIAEEQRTCEWVAYEGGAC